MLLLLEEKDTLITSLKQTLNLTAQDYNTLEHKLTAANKEIVKLKQLLQRLQKTTVLPGISHRTRIDSKQAQQQQQQQQQQPLAPLAQDQSNNSNNNSSTVPIRRSRTMSDPTTAAETSEVSLAALAQPQQQHHHTPIAMTGQTPPLFVSMDDAQDAAVTLPLEGEDGRLGVIASLLLFLFPRWYTHADAGGHVDALRDATKAVEAVQTRRASMTLNAVTSTTALPPATTATTTVTATTTTDTTETEAEEQLVTIPVVIDGRTIPAPR
jgi:hypothetical protein